MDDHKIVCRDNAHKVGAFFILQSEKDEDGDVITPLKLHKLLYYSQGICLAITGKPIFSERICAWKHGPVVPSVRREMPTGKVPLFSDIYENPDDCLSLLSHEEKDILSFVNDVYGKYTAGHLRNLTHEDSAWSDAFDSLNDEITQESMHDLFSKHIKDEDMFAKKHSSSEEEFEDISDILCILKSKHGEFISHEDFNKEVGIQ